MVHAAKGRSASWSPDADLAAISKYLKLLLRGSAGLRCYVLGTGTVKTSYCMSSRLVHGVNNSPGLDADLLKTGIWLCCTAAGLTRPQFSPVPSPWPAQQRALRLPDPAQVRAPAPETAAAAEPSQTCAHAALPGAHAAKWSAPAVPPGQQPAPGTRTVSTFWSAASQHGTSYEITAACTTGTVWCSVKLAPQGQCWAPPHPSCWGYAACQQCWRNNMPWSPQLWGALTPAAAAGPSCPSTCPLWPPCVEAAVLLMHCNLQATRHKIIVQQFTRQGKEAGNMHLVRTAWCTTQRIGRRRCRGGPAGTAVLVSIWRLELRHRADCRPMHSATCQAASAHLHFEAALLCAERLSQRFSALSSCHRGPPQE